MMQARPVFFFVILAFFTAFSASAIEVEVKVFEKSVNAVEARAKALKSAEIRGFEALIKQKAPAKSDQILRDYKSTDISRYVLGYQAKNEIVTDTSYRATLILNYDDRFIYNLTGNAPPVDDSNSPSNTQLTPQGNAILLIPVLRNASGIMLWESQNVWRSAVNETVLQSGNGEFVVPFGDPTDKLSLNASTILSTNYPRLVPSLNRYGANRALLAILHDRGTSGYGLTLREISPNASGQKISSASYKPNQTSGELMLETAETLIGNFMQKQQELANPAKLVDETIHQVNAYINLNNARDWNVLRQRLNAVPSIQSAEVTGADATSMTLQITFKGSPANFGSDLVSHQVSATQSNNKLWLALR